MRIDETISPEDHMMTADQGSYLRTSRSGLDAVLTGLTAAGREPRHIATVLDFGSGYGRVYRALAAAFPDARLTACDLMEPAARFCAETFGGAWVKSKEDLDGVELPDSYDLVWLGSVFTHLPVHRWRALLDFLARVTTPGGIVVFTTHGERAIQHIENVLLKRNPYAIDQDGFAAMKESLDDVGFDFIANKPAAVRHQQNLGISITQDEYGFSFSTEWWVRRLFAERSDFDLVNYAASGWGGNHDAVTIKKLSWSAQ
jgi:SAM-dependent methyltransferase